MVAILDIRMRLLLIDKMYSPTSFLWTRMIQGRGWIVAFFLCFILSVFISVDGREVYFHNDRVFLYAISYPVSLFFLSLMILFSYYLSKDKAIEYVSVSEVRNGAKKISGFSFVFYDSELVAQLMYYDDSLLCRLLKLPRTKTIYFKSSDQLQRFRSMVQNDGVPIGHLKKLEAEGKVQPPKWN